IGLGTLDSIQEDLQLAREVRLMNELLERIARDLPVAYGRAEVRRSVDYGACGSLLVVDSLLHDEGIIHLMDRAELVNAAIVVFSGSFDPGKQLEGLGGIAALLRYRIE
ncbi:MAG: mRNA surveillance protein Pelota, partial [Methanoregulaceae archaeon]|nr:mRNA surveillance protein Pelota [Methanoregulaceae archaeon]